MARKVHAGDAEAGAPRHLEVDDRQRDWDSRTALQHLVEKAVAWIVVPIPVPDEPLLVVQVFVQDLDGLEPVAAGVGHSFGGLLPQTRQLVDVRRCVERWILDSCDRQCSRGKLFAASVHRRLEIGRHLAGPGL